MAEPDPVLDSLRRAVQSQPDDVPLRLHLAALLVTAGRLDEAVAACAAALQREPANEKARKLMARAMSAGEPLAGEPAADEAAEPGGSAPGPATPVTEGIDWAALDAEFGDIAEPMFVGTHAAAPERAGWGVQEAGVTLGDVGGMRQVKDRLEAAFLAPLRNPGLRSLYGHRLGGGMLLWGPPGCGKTFLARAVAGEMGARFLSVGLTDVLDLYVGSSERNLHELFELARREAPVVVFLDEIDALGQKRSLHRSSGMRSQVNQLLTELDGIGSANDGVFVLSATNQPWDVDPALRRPGRFDRMLLVLPPDREAREAVFRYHLRHRPVTGIDLARLAKATEGYSGADIAHICETASERALLDSARTGQSRLITMADVQRAVGEVRPSVGPWFDSARNLVLFGDDEDTYAELRSYMRKTKRL
ncbi:MAG TPA: tetratricopeptide repeat protein [Propionibacteriaceae bacterium]